MNVQKSCRLSCQVQRYSRYRFCGNICCRSLIDDLTASETDAIFEIVLNYCRNDFKIFTISLRNVYVLNTLEWPNRWHHVLPLVNCAWHTVFSRSLKWENKWDLSIRNKQTLGSFLLVGALVWGNLFAAFFYFVTTWRFGEVVEKCNNGNTA